MVVKCSFSIAYFIVVVNLEIKRASSWALIRTDFGLKMLRDGKGAAEHV